MTAKELAERWPNATAGEMALMREMNAIADAEVRQQVYQVLDAALKAVGPPSAEIGTYYDWLVALRKALRYHMERL